MSGKTKLFSWERLARPRHLDVASGMYNRLLEGKGWIVQAKEDGIRVLVEITKGGQVKAWTRHGKRIEVPEVLGPSDSVLDGELVGDTVICFDAPIFAGSDNTRLGLMDRVDRMGELYNIEYCHTGDKPGFVARCRELGKEGVVFKAKLDHYPKCWMGARQDGVSWWKVRF